MFIISEWRVEGVQAMGEGESFELGVGGSGGKNGVVPMSMEVRGFSKRRHWR
ncbi:TonB-dependent siderophore receptor [Sesbania bispinosa]|nr:TonB-dependent siderophore receptor [Sesbania bispinosa]